MSSTPFAARLIHWQATHGRQDLPWQGRTPYAVWLSEIMLQQTQVSTVRVYYPRFLARFPDVAALAAAPLDEVLAYWAGLGYYSRARNLHRAAREVMTRFHGQFPRDAATLATLPGIGRSTAAAIASFCFGERVSILDGNVKRVLARWAGIEGFPGERMVEKQLWALAESLLPASAADMPRHTQGLMDLGALICTPRKPTCPVCPLREDCIALATGRTASLPTPRPKKTLPEHETTMLLIRHGKHWLLQQRPETGIWGGLWSLPELPADAEPLHHAETAFGLAATAGEAGPVLTHTFTHFRLHITPQPLSVLTAPEALPTGVRWFSHTEALQAGIPTPVRKLLLRNG